MCTRLRYSISIVAILAVAGVVQAAVFTDTFDTPHDYLTDGVDGTGWDGFIGKSPGETVDALNAAQDRAGQLFIQSTNSWWERGFFAARAVPVQAGPGRLRGHRARDGLRGHRRRDGPAQ
jgi:hypothetical protein